MRGDLPTGTVTFLFTDVEGSTALLERLGADAYAVALVRHREIVREALAQHGGVEVDTQGDAFFCAFGSARAAVACAAEIQQQLASTEIRVRMGLHTGEAVVVDRHYVGMDVHRAARIAACGHGGQVVLSPPTVALLEADVELRELGTHRLKDLAAPIVIHQLGHDEFPPLRTLYRTNLPVPATPFLGREGELAELVAIASEPGVRALTLTGPGGTGKTRLALQLAAELADAYPDGVWWVPLAPLRGGELIASAVASALGLEESGRSPAEAITESLARQRALLLLDNCEHVVAAAAEVVSAIVGRCSDVLVVVTSREPLAVGGEHVYSVLPLDVGDSFELFHARARAAGAQLDRDATRAAVTELCARLDHLPLAVELAAARAPVLPPAALLERLATRLDSLAGPRDAEERQRTLRSTIAWSCDLLDESERVLFRRFGVFVGGASLSAIEHVCEADLEDLFSLVAKSLVRQATTDEGEPRYWMLETVREFAVDELEASGTLASTRDGHAAWYAQFSRSRGALEVLAAGEHLPRLEPDVPNLRAALEHALVRPHLSADVTAIAAALLVQHLTRGRYAEAVDVARRVVALELEPAEAVVFHSMLGVALRVLGQPQDALASYLDAERLLDGIAERAPEWWNRWIGLKLHQGHFFYMENRQTELERVIAELDEAIAAHGTEPQRRDFLHLRQQHRYRVERYVLSAETEELAREIHALDLEDGAVFADFLLGFCLLWRGEPDEAETYFERGLEVARSEGVALIETRCLVYGLVACRKRNDVAGARARLQQIEALEELHGYRGLVRANTAWLAYRDGDHELAMRCGEEALAEWRAEGRTGYGVFEWTARFPLLGVAVARGDLVAARKHAVSMLDESQQPLPDDLATALREGERDAYARALELAHLSGYA
ncbi:MAG TPA: adenylate/guanylate cyclase domain-containing protein [Gaiellaceae bacterium]|nr:adenylate/guanylate cyclase domain-containing protein [Gaiellaceae bacterium]